VLSSRSLLASACRVGPIEVSGTINKVVGLVVESSGPPAAVGDLCVIHGGRGDVMTEVVGLRDEKVLSMALGNMDGIKTGEKIELVGERAGIPVGFGLMGRVLNGKCEPIDQKGPIDGAKGRSTPSPRLGRASGWGYSPEAASARASCWA